MKGFHRLYIFTFLWAFYAMKALYLEKAQIPSLHARTHPVRRPEMFSTKPQNFHLKEAPLKRPLLFY